MAKNKIRKRVEAKARIQESLERAKEALKVAKEALEPPATGRFLGVNYNLTESRKKYIIALERAVDRHVAEIAELDKLIAAESKHVTGTLQGN